MNKTKSNIPNFLKHFRINVETPAFQELTYNDESGTFTYGDPDVSDSTTAMTVWDRRAEQEDITDKFEPIVLFIELGNRDETTITEELADLFGEHDGDLDAFIEEAQENF